MKDDFRGRTFSDIRLRRIYESPDPGDGLRLLVDRLWPRGIARSEAQIDLWIPQFAPSTALREWYGHSSRRWPAFQKKYLSELANQRDAILDVLDSLLSDQTPARSAGPTDGQIVVLTLLHAARDSDRSNAAVLRTYLQEMLSKP